MVSSIDKEIDLMIKDLAIDPNDYHLKPFLNKLNYHLLSYKPEGWTSFVYGSTALGLATKNDTTDICVMNISNNTDAVNVRDLAPRLSAELKSNSLRITYSFQAPIPFFTVYSDSYFTKFDISVNNTIDIERTNLITEYLSLDKRVKPFLFALKQFIKYRKIDNEENGFPNSYVFVIIGLYFLMFVQSSPIIPCLHALSDKTSCNYPLCRSKSNEKIQGYDVTYHDCAIIDRIAEYDPHQKLSNKKLYGTPWVSKNTNSAGVLLLEAFKWFSYSSAILEPKSIRSMKSPVLQPEWEHNVMVFTDVFEPKLNIAASCTVEGAKIINQEFFNAYIKLNGGDSFDKVLNAPDTVLKPIAVKPRTYTRSSKS